MPILDERTSEQLRARFAERLVDPVELTLHTRPGTGRLVLPDGYGCATCDDARALAEAVAAAAPEKLVLNVVDVTKEEAGGGAPGAPTPVPEVPLLAVGAPGRSPRIRFQGLTAGYEFAAVVDAIERVSSGDHGLSEASVEALGALADDLEVLVFATPT